MKINRLSYSKKAYILGFELPFMQQMTGVNAIVTQVGAIITKYNQDLGDYTPLIINIVQLICTSLAIGLLRKVGRRPVINFGNLGLGVCNVLIGITFIFISTWSASITLVFGLLIVYMIIYGISLGPTVWLYVP
jgi:SP family sugar:H+ symporter-like MFS transporter